ncbi:hypothetical protein R3P38DRAFT_2813731 [Favolaschia claudopus]|uniref:Uncharacterized protein n=1 Tax=Favolaschia claudopus TaxID=2862362 RepID=A0AAV9Z501_9AGAR
MTRNLLNPKTTQTLGLILKKIQTLVFEYKKALRVKGGMAARIVDPFAHWPTVLSIGLRRDPNRNDNEDRFTDKENEDYRIFKALEALLIPNIREELMRQGPDAAVKLGKLVMSCLPILSSPPSLSFLQLNEGSKDAHALDVNSLKIALARWNPHWVPPYNSKHEARDGIPPWRVREMAVPSQPKSLKSFVMAPGFPNRKIISEDPDLNDLMSGFLRGDTLLRGFNHVFISLSTALNDAGTDKSTGKDTAAQHNISEVTLESIIYVAHINTFQAKGGNGLFAYRKYFKFLQRSVREWPEADQENLLTWWNEKVFSQMNDAKPAKRADGSLSIAERMAAQAANARRATGSH